VAKTVPVREFRSQPNQLLSDVVDHRDWSLATDRPAAAPVPINEYEALNGTAEMLSDRDALAALEEGLGELERGDAFSLEDLRRERAERRSSR
jgi:hypothetical protein